MKTALKDIASKVRISELVMKVAVISQWKMKHSDNTRDMGIRDGGI